MRLTVDGLAVQPCAVRVLLVLQRDSAVLVGKGPSRRETILSAAQKGFASKGYQKVYADYKEIVEEVMRSEKVPSSYKYYIKKYFTKIKPHEMD